MWPVSVKDTCYHLLFVTQIESNMSGMLQTQDDQVVDLKEWEQRWEENRIGFHKPHVHE